MRIFRSVTTGALGVLMFASTLARQDTPKLAIQITSPLGRTGMSGPVRLVARVTADTRTTLGPIRFFVDGKLVGEDKDGPPYAVEWTDDNPFETRQISVEVTDARGTEAKDLVELKPLEVYETTQVSSVLLEPSVLDAKAVSYTHLTLPTNREV